MARRPSQSLNSRSCEYFPNVVQGMTNGAPVTKPQVPNATIVQISNKVNAGYDRKASGHTVHSSLLWKPGFVAADWSVTSTCNVHVSIGTNRWSSEGDLV